MKKLTLFKSIVFISLFLISKQSFSAEEKTPSYEDKDIRIRFVLFTPQQIGSFYEGREFEKIAIELLMKSCYVTIILKNKTDDILWLDLDQWIFSQNGKVFARQNRNYWNQQWDKINITQAHRSTFSWTLMPRARNLYPDEGVGGRIPIPMQTEPFSLTLIFPTGENKQGKIKTVKIDNLHCNQDEN